MQLFQIIYRQPDVQLTSVPHWKHGLSLNQKRKPPHEGADSPNLV